MFEKYRNFIKKYYKLNILISIALLICDVIVLAYNSINFFSVVALILCVWVISRLYSWKHGHFPIFSKDTLWHTLRLMGYEEKYETISLNIASVALIFAFPFSIAGITIAVMQGIAI